MRAHEWMGNLIDPSSHSPANVANHLHSCGYYDSYHVASTSRPCLKDVNEHGEPIEDGKRDGRSNTRVIREERNVLMTCRA